MKQCVGVRVKVRFRRSGKGEETVVSSNNLQQTEFIFMINPSERRFPSHENVFIQTLTSLRFLVIPDWT